MGYFCFMSNGEKALGAARTIINKIQTTIDGGYRLTLDLPDSEIELIKTLMAFKADPYKQKELFVAFVEKKSNG